jgi:uncharacterized protein YgbK (DUF1537 family)
VVNDWLILADDLTGAADCAIAFGRRGRAAAVMWSDDLAASDRRLPVLAYDAASRGLSAVAAAGRHADVLARLSEPGRILFKKIDSTLRGHPAAETAATLAHMKLRSGPAFGVLAPAFPATGRTTVNGRILVKARPLEETELWQRDHSYPTSDLVDVLAFAGIRGEKVLLSTVRSVELKATFARLAEEEGDVVAVCDAETDHDLHLIAAAGLHVLPAVFFIGSAGLAYALAGLDADTDVEPLKIPVNPSGTLIVVGSLAGASRAAARQLAMTGTAVHFPVAPETLLGDAASSSALAADVMKRLAAGGDALVEITMDDQPVMSLGPRLAQRLAELLAPAAASIGAFAATGGETAATLLSRFGVYGIRLADEIEPGVSLGLTLGARSVPVATKAGAFGDELSLIRISERLRAARTKGSFT